MGYRGRGFPGSQPVSMDIANKDFLMKKDYMVSWKADGIRYVSVLHRERPGFSLKYVASKVAE